jgi:DNA-binding MarR family transcriptional regulator
MSRKPVFPYATTRTIGRDCLCLRIQRASRTIGRRFDEALRPVGLNNWQFTLLVTLNQPSPITVNGLAEELGMDRTTTTKNLKPLERRGLLEIRQDEKDARVRRIVLTASGHGVLVEALPYWQAANDAVAASLKGGTLACLRSALDTIASS